MTEAILRRTVVMAKRVDTNELGWAKARVVKRDAHAWTIEWLDEGKLDVRKLAHEIRALAPAATLWEQECLANWRARKTQLEGDLCRQKAASAIRNSANLVPALLAAGAFYREPLRPTVMAQKESRILRR